MSNEILLHFAFCARVAHFMARNSLAAGTFQLLQRFCASKYLVQPAGRVTLYSRQVIVEWYLRVGRSVNNETRVEDGI